MRLGSAYGYRQAPIAGASIVPRRENDIPGADGDAGPAYKSGTVSYTGWDSGGGGNMVQIDHPDGTKSAPFCICRVGALAVKPMLYVSQGPTDCQCGALALNRSAP